MQDPHTFDVFQRDVIELDLALDVLEFGRVGFVGDFGLRVEDFEDALRAHHGALEHVVLHDQTADGLEEALDGDGEADDERDPFSFAQAAACQTQSRPDDDGADRHRSQDLDHGGDQGGKLAGVAGGPQVPLIDLVEAFTVLALTAEALHDAHAAEVFVERAVDGGDRFAHLEEGPSHATGPEEQEDHQDGQHGDGDDRELPVDENERHDHDAEADHVSDGLQDAGADHLLQDLDVRGNAGHDAADFGIVVELV